MRDDVGQLLWVGFAGPSVPAALRGKLDRGEVGATLVFKRNLAFAAGEGGAELVDLDGGSRKELVLALRFPTVRTVVVYSAPSSPERLELVGEAQSFQFPK